MSRRDVRFGSVYVALAVLVIIILLIVVWAEIPNVHKIPVRPVTCTLNELTNHTIQFLCRATS